jgi:NAD(P)-dependent dehydrogenase (short-subunit alcohol dehydrogenase family)
MYIVTGGSRGLGRGLAHVLAERGEQVLILGRQANLLQETAAFSPKITYFKMDVTSEADRDRLYQYLQDTPKIKGLVHNAGIIEPISRIKALSLHDWRANMMTNVEAPLFLSQGLLPKLADSRVLHIGSGLAYFPALGLSSYCVSKAALSMLTKCCQLEFESPVFASVMPGIVDTLMVTAIRKSTHMSEEKIDFFERLKQENRLLTPETVACFLSWLLLDVEKEIYASQEWDIYDQSHHAYWLVHPHVVPDIT